MSKRRIISVFVLVVIAVVLIATNPTKQEYVAWMKYKVRESGRGGVGATAFALFGGPLLDANTIRTNDVLFSVFKTAFDNKSKFEVIGIFDRFFVVPSH